MGLVFETKTNLPKYTHAQNPFIEDLEFPKIRIHFASRDNQNRSHAMCIETTYFDLTSGNKLQIKPFQTLDLGEIGAFDDCGVMPHCIVKQRTETLLYYTGWSKSVTVPFSFHIGLAKRLPLDRNFSRVSKAPIIGRTNDDPFIVGAPFVLGQKPNLLMFYTSLLKWEEEGDQISHHYFIKRSTSLDGHKWQSNSEFIIKPFLNEIAQARPVAIKYHGKNLLFFSSRSKNSTYKLELAKFEQAGKFTRLPSPTFAGAPDWWEIDMRCYAWPFIFQNELFILFNGNGYGVDGFGIAKLEV